uniref:Uncharacterized protein n=1 Tax=Glossina palpalis gambiensis TaxID=67801 RepID=A0A1B0BVX1_9MUSC
MSMHLAIMNFHMVEPNIGKRTQATILKQLAFFKKTGSCPNGRSHLTNLLGFMIHLVLTGKNWVQETVTNEKSCFKSARKIKSNSLRLPPHIDEDSLHAKDTSHKKSAEGLMEFLIYAATHLVK